MDVDIPRKNFEFANNITEVDPTQDWIYRYDSQEQTRARTEKSWTKDPHYFNKVKMSAVALIKMVMHARSGGNIEVMGLMQGKIDGSTIIIMDAFALPVEGTETRVNAADEANEYMVTYQTTIEQAGRLENIVGWYHSHPGYGCWLSGIDVTTQMSNQQYQDPWVAVVIDPNRTIAAGKVEIGAFRTYPEGYKAPDEGPSEYQTIPLSKIEDFGVHCKQYYQLEISYFKSTLDTHLLELLWNKYWVNTLSQSPLIANRGYAARQISDLAEKLEQTESQIQQSGRIAGFVTGGLGGGNRISASSPTASSSTANVSASAGPSGSSSTAGNVGDKKKVEEGPLSKVTRDSVPSNHALPSKKYLGILHFQLLFELICLEIMAATARPAKVNSVEGVSSSYYVGKMGRNKDSLTIGKQAIVCQDTELRGEIFVGAGTVLNPQCKILAESGPIRIGANNIIEEKVIIVNKSTKPLTIGDDNVFEVGCYIEGTKIGNKNVIEAKASVLGTTTVGDNCVIGAVCSTRTDEVIPDNTVIYGDMHNRRIQTVNTNQTNLHTRHLDYLRETLPKFNHIKGGNESKSAGKESRDKLASKESRDKPRSREHRDKEHRDKEHQHRDKEHRELRDRSDNRDKEHRELRDKEHRELRDRSDNRDRSHDRESRERSRDREAREARDKDSHEKEPREKDKKEIRDREPAKKVGITKET
ncbi:4805_t:CDS:10 [Paraglomus brasilianum]|uniref:COP9 signalosome complex subunit 5 n=1 Tax=Paraglomus brasilianum TaxID=144538 RepID=A0A9N9FWX3_9GLOM|nr:4805_t:CDS:10 [Paraglomus brasilianum]